jgi:hypothetical protein
MPKNIKGGNKTKKGKNTRAVQPLVLSSTDTKYAVVVANLGNGRCNLNIVGKSGIECPAQGYIRGCVRRAKFLKDDLVLCGLRNFTSINAKEQLEVDIILKYNLDHYHRLVEIGEIKSLGITPEEDDCGIDFTNNDSDSDADADADAETNAETEPDTITDLNNESSEPKIKLSIQNKIDKIALNGKKAKALNNAKRDIKKQNEIYDIMSTQIDNFKFDDI